MSAGRVFGMAAIVGAVSLAGIGIITTNRPRSDAQVVNFSPASGPAGATGPAGPASVSAPNARTLSLATAYQATNTAKPASVLINLTSTASFSLIGGSTNTADVVIGATSAVASGTGTVVCKYSNSSTAGVAVGVGVSSIQATTCPFDLPVGWFFAVRQTSGTVTITSAFDSTLG